MAGSNLTGDTTDGGGGGPTLSVVVRTQGRRRHGLLEALTSLAAQSCDDFEVLVVAHDAAPAELDAVAATVEQFASSFRSRVRVLPVAGGGRGRPLNAGVEHACGDYVAFLDDDDVVTRGWVEQFAHAIRDHPGRIVRGTVATQQIEPAGDGSGYRAFGLITHPFPARFDLLRHLHANATPICSFAVPRATFSTGGLRFREDLAVYEDWALLLDAAMVCGVHDTGRCTSLYHLWTVGHSSFHTVAWDTWVADLEKIRSRLDAAPLVLPPGSLSELVQLVDHDAHHAVLVDELVDSRRRLAHEWRAKSYAVEAQRRALRLAVIWPLREQVMGLEAERANLASALVRSEAAQVTADHRARAFEEAALQRDAMLVSRQWRVGRLIVGPVRRLRRLLWGR